MLLDQRFPSERLRAYRYVEVIHRAGAVEDLYLRVRQARADQSRQRVVVDHDFKRKRAFIASANPRASPRVSGSLGAPFASAAATPEARTIPQMPIRTAGRPLARNAPS